MTEKVFNSDLALEIFEGLNNRSLCNARLVCKEWNSLITSEKFWWKRIIKNEIKVATFCRKKGWRKKGWRKLVKHILAIGHTTAIEEFGFVILENLVPVSAKTFSIIHFCSEYGLSSLLEIILKYVDGKDTILEFGWHPIPLYFALSYAAKEGHIEILEQFVQHFGSNVFIDFKKQYPDGRLSPLYYAERNEDLKMIQYLEKFPM